MKNSSLRIVFLFIFVCGGCTGADRTMKSDEFGYIDEVARTYGIDDVQLVSRKQEIIDSLTETDIATLAGVYREIEKHDHVKELCSYIDEDSGDPRRHCMLMLLFLFGNLAKRDVKPFASGTVAYVDEEEGLNWEKLPLELRYLAGPAEKYGAYQFDNEVDELMDTISVSEEQLLRKVAERARHDADKIDKLLQDFPITDHSEAARVYYLMVIFDRLDVPYR